MALGSAYVHYILLLSIVIYFIVVFCIYQQNPVSFAFKRVSFVFNVWRAAISCTIFPFALFALVNACPLQCITLICDWVCTIVMHQSTKLNVICIQESVFCKQAGAVSFYWVGCGLQNPESATSQRALPGPAELRRLFEKLGATYIKLGQVWLVYCNIISRQFDIPGLMPDCLL